MEYVRVCVCACVFWPRTKRITRTCSRTTDINPQKYGNNNRNVISKETRKEKDWKEKKKVHLRKAVVILVRKMYADTLYCWKVLLYFLLAPGGEKLIQVQLSQPNETVSTLLQNNEMTGNQRRKRKITRVMNVLVLNSVKALLFPAYVNNQWEEYTDFLIPTFGLLLKPYLWFYASNNF